MPRRNLEAVLADLAPGCGLDAVGDMVQVHGRHVVVATPGRARQEADGIVTDRPGVVLVARAADCVPVLFADAAAGVIGAAHAGRGGVELGVVEAVVGAMRDLGATDVTAWIGPYVCGRCYEVPSALQDDVAAVVPATRSTTSWGTPALDLGAGVRAQLETAGVAVVDVSSCTRENPDLYSHRRDGARAGRHAGLIHRRAT